MPKREASFDYSGYAGGADWPAVDDFATTSRKTFVDHGRKAAPVVFVEPEEGA